MILKNVFVCKNPIIQDSLSRLRNKKTSLHEFRENSDRICYLLFAEATKSLSCKKGRIETPLCETMSRTLNENIVVVPVLRSGIAMLFGAMDLLPNVKVGFVGLERDECTAVAREYYWKLPKIDHHTTIIVTDPMLATGGSILHLLRRMAKENPKEMRVASVLAAPEGIEAIHQEFPKVKIFTASVDQKLNDKKYIVPGLGDYGDRYFNTV
jgi:uracil phosphoribosyltransferase